MNSMARTHSECAPFVFIRMKRRREAEAMSYLTKILGTPDSDDIKPGMAHLEGTGPIGATCEHCAHRGYFRTGKAKFNSRTGMIEENRVRTLACRMFLKLTHRHGPTVDKNWRACRYFQPK